MQKPQNAFYQEMDKQKNRFLRFLKWLMISGVIGILVGLLGTAFSYGMKLVTATRETHPMIILGLPLGGLLIVFLYHCFGMQNDAGTNSHSHQYWKDDLHFHHCCTFKYCFLSVFT